MKIDSIVRQLDGLESWSTLGKELGDNENTVVNSLMRHLQVLNAKSYVLESTYIDRDYSADYIQFYAQTFRAHERHCKRIHFFLDDITKLLPPLTSSKVEVVQQFAERNYCGFCVIRPLPNASIGRTVLTARVRGYSGMESAVTCRAKYDVNLFGVDLAVTGSPFLQQDARVGACAQVAIWAGMRHMHARHQYNWVSLANITRYAAHTTSSEAASLPAGSEFLTSESMVKAINEVGFQPLCFREGPEIGKAILPYVESGIPVILGLEVGNTLGHAVTVIGRVFAKQECPTNKAIDYVPAYIVHDDQAGPYMWLAMDDKASQKFPLVSKDIVKHSINGNIVESNVSDHAVFAVALMSTRVFSTAQAAEVTASDSISEFLNTISKVRKNLLEKKSGVNERLMDELESAFKQDQLVLRTYLTSAAGYRRHLARGTACSELKNTLLNLHLPHFTWITEISTTDSYNHSSPGMRRIFGHTVLDATSTGKDKDGLLMLHLPGLVLMNDVNAAPDEQEKVIAIRNDKLYEGRYKGF